MKIRIPYYTFRKKKNWRHRHGANFTWKFRRKNPFLRRGVTSAKNVLWSVFNTVWKVSKYGVIYGSYFPVVKLNTDMYRVNLRIQSEYRKTRTRNNLMWTLFTQCKYYAKLFQIRSSLLSKLLPLLFLRFFQKRDASECRTHKVFGLRPVFNSMKVYNLLSVHMFTFESY